MILKHYALSMKRRLDKLIERCYYKDMGRPTGTTKTRKIDPMSPKPKDMPWYKPQHDGCKLSETCESCPLKDCNVPTALAGKNLA